MKIYRHKRKECKQWKINAKKINKSYVGSRGVFTSEIVNTSMECWPVYLLLILKDNTYTHIRSYTWKHTQAYTHKTDGIKRKSKLLKDENKSIKGVEILFSYLCVYRPLKMLALTQGWSANLAKRSAERNAVIIICSLETRVPLVEWKEHRWPLTKMFFPLCLPMSGRAANISPFSCPVKNSSSHPAAW